MKQLILTLCSLLAINASHAAASQVVTAVPLSYPDGRPAAAYRLEANDHGAVLKYSEEYLQFFSSTICKAVNSASAAEAVGLKRIWSENL